MALQAYIGEPFTFQALFLDVNGAPLAVTSPNITLFYYTDSSSRVVLVDGDAMVPVSPPDPSRYTYLYTIPTSLEDGMTLYVECRGTDPSSHIIMQPDTVLVRFQPSDLGLRARFVQ